MESAFSSFHCHSRHPAAIPWHEWLYVGSRQGGDVMAAMKEVIEGWTGDEEVEAVLAEFDGDPRKAIRALLDDIAVLADDRPEPRIHLVGGPNPFDED